MGRSHGLGCRWCPTPRSAPAPCCEAVGRVRREGSGAWDVSVLLPALRYLASRRYVDCGIENVVVLEFDHRDRESKLDNVGSMMVSKRWQRVRAEIDKCDVRCVNCHRRKTARDLKWRMPGAS